MEKKLIEMIIKIKNENKIEIDLNNFISQFKNLEREAFKKIKHTRGIK